MRVIRGRRLLLAAVLAAGAVLLPTAAQAATPLSAAASCLPGADTAADRAIATRLRPLMTGQRLGAAVSGRSIACARVIVRIVQLRGLPRRAAVIALTTAITESTLKNHLTEVDHDSLGLFQQRPSQGWGRPEQLVDPVYATDAFLNAMIRKYPGDSWLSGDVGAICQRVQTSAFPAAYGREVHDAALILSKVWTDVPAAHPGTVQPQPAATSVGPFQRAIATAATELGPLDGRHTLAMTDWNGDKRPDLMVVKGTGTVTGGTEVRIMNGAGNLSSLLLNTATVLGPAEDGDVYSVGDWNGDNRPDLMVLQKAGTQLRIVDGASNFQRLLLETTVGLAGVNEVAPADWNGDGRLDLVAVRTAGTASGKVEVQVLDGAANLQQPLGLTVTTKEAAADGLRASVTDWNGDKRPDLVLVSKTGLRVLDGAGQLSRPLTQATVATDDRHEALVSDWNGDGRPDLVVVQKTGTASGRAEVSILGG
ncbi:FG-GAP repeat domain-containing protein [Actinoplanes regularis]|uniref:FG-GAP repeat domain-containing protein n=1 Tax=Actinoplanes regularis TaxID=52697 RepID=UPI0025548014|nr:VCBS repeat-containing protein [Actinoplanes regularis]GLW27747.1 hypothetical protein Areg01_06870 [Actinoplanes regularis]